MSDAPPRDGRDAAIDEFSENIAKFKRGELTADQFRPLRLAMGVYMQLAHVKHMQRIKIPGGRVTAAQLEALADVTERWGRGIAHVTTRQRTCQAPLPRHRRDGRPPARARRGRDHHGRRVRGHRAQRHGVAPRRRRAGRALRRVAVRARGDRALPLPPAQPQAPAQIQDRPLRQRARSRAGHDQRHRPVRRGRWRGDQGLQGLRRRRSRLDAGDRAPVEGVLARARSARRVRRGGERLLPRRRAQEPQEEPPQVPLAQDRRGRVPEAHRRGARARLGREGRRARRRARSAARELLRERAAAARARRATRSATRRFSRRGVARTRSRRRRRATASPR